MTRNQPREAVLNTRNKRHDSTSRNTITDPRMYFRYIVAPAFERFRDQVHVGDSVVVLTNRTVTPDGGHVRGHKGIITNIVRERWLRKFIVKVAGKEYKFTGVEIALV